MLLVLMRKVQKICAIFVSVLGGFFLLCAAAAATFFYVNTAPDEALVPVEAVAYTGENGEVRVEVRDGESASSVGNRLKTARLIKSYYAWQLLCHIRPVFLKTGMYQFEQGLSLLDLHDLLTSGRQMLVAVTIPEGSTILKTAAIFENTGICSADDFIEAAQNQNLLREFNIDAASFEGFLYPDTYYFSFHYPAALVIRTMAGTFYKRLKMLAIDSTAFTSKELYNKVILASIIEREYRIEDEAPLISGVFLNRLELGMRLESCATVEYIITQIQGKPHPKRLFHRDLEIINPYNTYLYGGLPPAPIASPGAVALRAAFFPEHSDYLFFRIVDPSAGRHYFSKSFDDHIKAGELLIK